MNFLISLLVLVSFSAQADNTAYLTCLQEDSESECEFLKVNSKDSEVSNPSKEEDSWNDRLVISPGGPTLDRLKVQSEIDNENNIDYEKKYEFMKAKMKEGIIYPDYSKINGKADSFNQFASKMSAVNSDLLGCLANLKRSTKAESVKHKGKIDFDMDYSFGEDTVNFISTITLNAIDKDYEEISSSQLGFGGRKKLSPLFQASQLSFFQEYQLPFFNESYYLYQQDQNRCSFWLDPEINKHDPNVKIEKIAVSDDDKEAEKCYHFITSRRIVPKEMEEVKKTAESNERINFELIGLQADQEYIWSLERRICNGIVLHEFEKQNLYLIDECNTCESGETNYTPESPLD